MSKAKRVTIDSNSASKLGGQKSLSKMNQGKEEKKRGGGRKVSELKRRKEEPKESIMTKEARNYRKNTITYYTEEIKTGTQKQERQRKKGHDKKIEKGMFILYFLFKD